ncbi:hypothetical protein MGYG_06106 [Nannizzia gypsea CBS 118893]|uniref:Uncharacterized protein n=1 Tax=Arthroderma gypseum (strain ATCC MYA-4604 / CBS 118893) TaxID=535722 RepID=E4V0H4_ARTGP|nr:hypothetical protein MGYG_06106 [Nannizzia gypsea CBS 118893]EFR03111.1 hypothetical protein MGYG_06106 [Nannizzia gypsea CBS 118893]
MERPMREPPFDKCVFDRLKKESISDAENQPSLTGQVTARAGPETARPSSKDPIQWTSTSSTSRSLFRGTSPFEPLLPASYRVSDAKGKPCIVTASVEYIYGDLSVKRLNDVDDWLWLAGRPMPPRPLSYQLACSRNIIINEQADLHLVWTAPGGIFLKPIPRYLLDYQFWKDNIVYDIDLYKCAFGFLLSYVALIQYESDFHIAKDKHLVPENLTWDSWTGFVSELLRKKSDETINKRYHYGELRLSRLNKIYWARCYLRGYRLPYQSYGEMFNANIAPVAGTTVYIALVLTAMQVGLATHNLSDSTVFHTVSYGFALFSILAPLFLVFLVYFVLSMFVIYNFIATIIFQKRLKGGDQNGMENKI